MNAPVEFSQDQLGKITNRPSIIYDMFPLLPGNYKLSVLRQKVFVPPDTVILIIFQIRFLNLVYRKDFA